MRDLPPLPCRILDPLSTMPCQRPHTACIIGPWIINDPRLTAQQQQHRQEQEKKDHAGDSAEEGHGGIGVFGQAVVQSEVSSASSFLSQRPRAA